MRCLFSKFNNKRIAALTSNCGSISGLCGKGGRLGRSCKSSYRGAGGGALLVDP